MATIGHHLPPPTRRRQEDFSIDQKVLMLHKKWHDVIRMSETAAASSADEAVAAFLSELRQYKHHKHKAVREKTGVPAEPARTTPHKRSTLYKRAGQKRTPPPPPAEDDRPTRSISKSAWKTAQDRLAPLPPPRERPRKRAEPEEPLPPPQPLGEPTGQFRRLHEDSVDVPKRRQKLRDDAQKEEDHELLDWRRPKLRPESRALANAKEQKFVEDQFENAEPQLTASRLTIILRNLGILESREDLTLPPVAGFCQSIASGDDRYDSQAAKAALLGAVENPRQSSFHSFASAKMGIASSNRKGAAQPGPEVSAHTERQRTPRRAGSVERASQGSVTRSRKECKLETSVTVLFENP
jgi:hypothetical protein